MATATKKKVKLTAAQAKQVTRTVEFSIYSRVHLIDKAFPSVNFKCTCQSNGGVTKIYQLTGPTIWVDKIERQYAY